MKTIKSPYYGFRFPPSVISCLVRWYHRFNLSLRDIEELLLERGVSEPHRECRRLRILAVTGGLEYGKRKQGKKAHRDAIFG